MQYTRAHTPCQRRCVLMWEGGSCACITFSETPENLRNGSAAVLSTSIAAEPPAAWHTTRCRALRCWHAACLRRNARPPPGAEGEKAIAPLAAARSTHSARYIPHCFECMLDGTNSPHEPSIPWRWPTAVKATETFTSDSKIAVQVRNGVMGKVGNGKDGTDIAKWVVKPGACPTTYDGCSHRFGSEEPQTLTGPEATGPEAPRDPRRLGTPGASGHEAPQVPRCLRSLGASDPEASRNPRRRNRPRSRLT